MTPRDPRWPSDADSSFDEPAPDVSSVEPVRERPRRRSTLRAMETALLASTAALLAAVAWPIATGSRAPAPPQAPSGVVAPKSPTQAPMIQLALLLDTSSSMDGLLDQARSQLWAVVNALDSATFEGATPRLQIAIYEYGNDGLSAAGGYIRQVVPFSSELDVVSEGLFGLATAGGDEFAGQAIDRATRELRWDDADNVLRVLYIAGNEEFSQGPMDFRETVAAARAKGIVVNTVNCTTTGGWEAGWQEAARIGGGKALRIDQDAKQAYVASPHDDEIEAISTKINDTYLGYGQRAEVALRNQVSQDGNSASAGRASSIARAMSKTSKLYDNRSWDLVDATAQGVVDLSTLDRDQLPGDLEALSTEELERKVETASKEREALKKKLRSLQKKRDAYVAARRTDDGTRLDDAIIESITTQAQSSGFTL
ncbi:MAG: VWA domain-containing protein [Nannocystaceae bacterium]|nr:VWA domain-containing protein [bacterium]